MNGQERLAATLSHEQPDRVCVDIFNDGGGFVFNTVHNIQGNVPIDNVLAMFRAIKDSRRVS